MPVVQRAPLRDRAELRRRESQLWALVKAGVLEYGSQYTLRDGRVVHVPEGQEMLAWLHAYHLKHGLQSCGVVRLARQAAA
jgi:hypothetical protein